MNIQFENLAQRPECVGQVIHWWFSVWSDYMDVSQDDCIIRLQSEMSQDGLPHHILATIDGKVVGSAALKNHELEDRFPDLKFWLGSVYVEPASRGFSIASRLSMKIVEMAKQRNIPQLFLQTQLMDGGLYRKSGWEKLREFDNNGQSSLLMVKGLD